MAGTRIQHPTERNVTFTLVDSSRPYTEPYDCPVCFRVHEFKTYHLQLDEVGAVTVSDGVLERLKAIPGQPFQITNEVANPPDQTINVPGGR